MDTFTNFDYLKLYPFNFETYQFQNYLYFEETHKKYVSCHILFKIYITSTLYDIL